MSETPQPEFEIVHRVEWTTGDEELVVFRLVSNLDLFEAQFIRRLREEFHTALANKFVELGWTQWSTPKFEEIEKTDGSQVLLQATLTKPHQVPVQQPSVFPYPNSVRD